MLYSENTRIGELMNNESAKAVSEKYFPCFTSNRSLGLAKGFTLKALSHFPQSNITPDQLKACAEDLSKLERTGFETIKGFNQKICSGDFKYKLCLSFLTSVSNL